MAMEGEGEKKIKLRNYLPEDASLFERREAAQGNAPAEAEAEPAQEQEQERGGDEAVDLQPKKANWDLKRDVAPKLQKLERRTQAAMVELMKEEERARQAS